MSLSEVSIRRYASSSRNSFPSPGGSGNSQRSVKVTKIHKLRCTVVELYLNYFISSSDRVDQSYAKCNCLTYKGLPERAGDIKTDYCCLGCGITHSIDPRYSLPLVNEYEPLVTQICSCMKSTVSLIAGSVCYPQGWHLRLPICRLK